MRTADHYRGDQRRYPRSYPRRCRVKVEILGFTTRLEGGQSREVAHQRKTADAGRLNDLRHIIYKSADALRAASLTSMLRGHSQREHRQRGVDVGAQTLRAT